MASVARLPRRRFWYACYRDATGRQHCVSTKIEHSPSGKDAKERARQTAEFRRLALDVALKFEEAERGNATESHLRKVLGDISERVNQRKLEFKRTRIYLTEWLDRASKSKSWRTGLRYKKIVNDFLTSLGAKAEAALNDITPRDVQKFVDLEVETGKGATSIRMAAKILNIPFNLAMRQGLLLQNPVPGVEIPEAANESRAPFTWAQVQDLVKCAKGEWKTAILLAAYTGTRLGDVVSMRWQNLDLEKRVLKFRPGKTARAKRDLEIPLHPTLADHLLSLRSVDNPLAPLLPGLAAQKIPGRSGLSRQFMQILNEAAIEQESVKAAGAAARTFNKFSFHSLRHTYVSLLANAGIAPDVRQLLSGHADERSHAVYTHTQVETLRRAIDALPKLKRVGH